MPDPPPSQVLTVLKLISHKWADTPALLRHADVSHVVPYTACRFRIKETDLFRLIILFHLIMVL